MNLREFETVINDAARECVADMENLHREMLGKAEMIFGLFIQRMTIARSDFTGEEDCAPKSPDDGRRLKSV